mgnify:CR=1 FL=1
MTRITQAPNFKKKIETETKLLCKIHKDTLVGLKYFHDITQKIPREEITKAEDVIKEHINKPLVIVRTEELVSHAIERLKKYNISQI